MTGLVSGRCRRSRASRSGGGEGPFPIGFCFPSPLRPWRVLGRKGALTFRDPAMAGLHASHAAERQGLSPVRAAWGAARVRLGAPNAAADWRAVGRVCRPGPGALGPGQDPLTRGGGPSRSRSTPALSAGLKPTWPRAPPSLPPPRESAAATARSQGGGPAEMSSQHLRRGRAPCPLPFTSGRGPQVSGKHRQDGRRAQRREGAPGGAERVLSPARREHFTFSLARPRAPPGRLPSPPP